MDNPLLQKFEGPFGLPPFGVLRDADFAPAFEAALAQARARVAAIADDPAAPTFANVIAALELSEEHLDQVSAVFYNLSGADSNPAREALERDLAPKLAAYASDVTMNAGLWAKISDLWARRDSLGLGAEEARVLELYERRFRRAGAALD
ncbi:MAG: peptidase M3, partial [Rhodobacteraceae bacterium]|nr:peptidase M3 [Paracoccaceae bacterium]